jgi:hypothetical protein
MCWCGQIGCDGNHPELSPSAVEIAKEPPHPYDVMPTAFRVDPEMTMPLRIDPLPLDPSMLALKAVQEMQEQLVAAERKRRLAEEANAACGRCRFWAEPPEGVRIGHCRIQRPVASTAVGAFRTAVWPETYPQDWCGEFEPKGAA